MLATVTRTMLLLSLFGCGRGPDSARVPGDGMAAQRPAPVSAVGFIWGQPRLVAVSREGLVVWDTNRGEVVRRQELSGGYAILGRTLSPDGRHLVLSHATGAAEQFETRVVDVASGATTALKPVASGSASFAIAADSVTVMRLTKTSGTPSVDVHFWRLPSVEPFANGRIEGTEVGPVTVAISPAGDQFAFGTHRRTRENYNPAGAIGRIRICETATSRVLATLETPEIPRALLFSRDGAELYWGTDGDAEIHVADARAGKEVASFADRPNSKAINPGRGGVLGAVHLMSVTPDGAHVMTASQSELAVKIWSPSGRTLIHTIRLGDRASSIAASADGSDLAIGSMGGGTSIWNLREPFALVRSLMVK